MRITRPVAGRARLRAAALIGVGLAVSAALGPAESRMAAEDGRSPRLLAEHGGAARAVAADDRGIYVARGSRLLVYALDAADGDEPLATTSPTGRMLIDVAATDDGFVVASGGPMAGKPGSLHVFDVRMHEAPRLVGKLTLDGDPGPVVARAGWAWVAEGAAVRAVDLRDPSRPVAAGRARLPGVLGRRYLALSGTTLVGVQVHGFWISPTGRQTEPPTELALFDIATPDAPVSLGERYIDPVLDVASLESTVFLLTDAGALQRTDVGQGVLAPIETIADPGTAPALGQVIDRGGALLAHEDGVRVAVPGAMLGFDPQARAAEATGQVELPDAAPYAMRALPGGGAVLAQGAAGVHRLDAPGDDGDPGRITATHPTTVFRAVAAMEDGAWTVGRGVAGGRMLEELVWVPGGGGAAQAVETLRVPAGIARDGHTLHALTGDGFLRWSVLEGGVAADRRTEMREPYRPGAWRLYAAANGRRFVESMDDAGRHDVVPAEGPAVTVEGPAAGRLAPVGDRAWWARAQVAGEPNDVCILDLASMPRLTKGPCRSIQPSPIVAMAARGEVGVVLRDAGVGPRLEVWQATTDTLATIGLLDLSRGFPSIGSAAPGTRLALDVDVAWFSTAVGTGQELMAVDLRLPALPDELGALPIGADILELDAAAGRGWAVTAAGALLEVDVGLRPPLEPPTTRLYLPRLVRTQD